MTGNDTTDPQDIPALLTRIAAALERLSPHAPAAIDFSSAGAFVWQGETATFQAVPEVSLVPLSLLKGIDRTAAILLENTRRFARGLPANNALLWGARGMGKSSLVKAVHAEVSATPSPLPSRGEGPCHWHVFDMTCEGRQQTSVQAAAPRPNPLPMQGQRMGRGDSKLILIEIHREEIGTLPACLAHLKASTERFIVFCDDLSFDKDDTSYKSLKAMLEGGIEGRPANVIFYATSNRRHLMPRQALRIQLRSELSGFARGDPDL